MKLRVVPAVVFCFFLLDVRINAATFVVTNTNDNGTGSLRKAIADSSANAQADTITFDPILFSTTQVISLATGNLDLLPDVNASQGTYYSLTIIGPGSNLLTIDANNQSRIFLSENGGLVTLSGMTLSHGYAPKGGAIWVRNDLDISDAVIANNVAEGGEIANGINAARGGGLLVDGSVVIRNSLLSNNTARGVMSGSGFGTAASGGAIYGTSVRVVNCTFVSNSALGSGAVEGRAGGGSSFGGAVSFNGGASSTVVNSSFINNSAIGGNGSLSDGNGGAAYGGAIYSSGQKVLNAVFTGNIAKAGNGGGNFGNGSEARGGAIFEASSGWIANATIVQNSVTAGNGYLGGKGNGGGISLSDQDTAAWQVVNSTITNNSVVGGNGSQTSGTGNGGGVYGVTQGGLGGSPNFRNNIVSENTAQFGPDLFGTFPAASKNLIRIGDSNANIVNGIKGNLVGTAAAPLDPMLGPLADNGGVTKTRALLAGSPAIDAGNNSAFNPLLGSGELLLIDQRNFPRIYPVGGDIDIGAFEYGTTSVPLEPTSPDLRSTSDTGDSSSDNITMSTAPVFDISNAIPGARVVLLRNNAVVAAIDASVFAISLTDPSPPLDATVQYTCQQTIGGVTSVASTPLNVTFDHTSPTATINQAASQLDPTRVTPINFTIVFSERVGSPGPLSYVGSTANTNTASQSASSTDQTTYNIGVSFVTANGLAVLASLPQGGYKDLAGNPGLASTSVDNSVTLDNVRPSVTINQASTQSDPTPSQPLNFTATFTEPVTGLNASGITLAGSTANVSQAAISVTGGPVIYTVSISGVTSSGQVRAAVRVNSVQDALGNLNFASTSSDGVVTLNVPRPSFDFDGDRRTDISVFRPSDNTWYLNRSQLGFTSTKFGITGDILSAADFTGDGKADIAVFRPAEGIWYVLRSEDGTFYGSGFGTSGDVPAPADYDGDGKADLAVYRPGSGTWYVQRSTAGFLAVQFGIAEDRPAVGDFDGDGKADISVYRPSTGSWYRLNSSSGSVFSVQFGTSGDEIVPTDYTGDGKADIAVWRPSNGTWYVLKSEDLSFYGVGFGISGDLPVPGDYDGDGRTDLAVYRPSLGTWYLQQSTSGFNALQFGTAEDKPTPNIFVY